MPKCTICSHKSRDEIDESLLRGESERSVADRFGVTKSAIHRHKAVHLATRMAQAIKAKREQDICSGGDLFEQFLSLKDAASSHALLLERLVDKLNTDSDGKGGPLLRALAEHRKYVDFRCGLLEQEVRIRKLAEDPQASTDDYLDTPQFKRFAAITFEALRNHPQAAADLREAWGSTNDERSLE
jgi:hypothetical protein